jgi:hypothetical protein
MGNGRDDAKCVRWHELPRGARQREVLNLHRRWFDRWSKNADWGRATAQAKSIATFAFARWSKMRRAVVRRGTQSGTGCLTDGSGMGRAWVGA